MSSLLKPTLSRWGRSVYEQLNNIETEKKQLTEYVHVVDDNCDAEIIVIHSKQKIDAQVLLPYPSIKLIITTTSGIDHIEQKAVMDRNIRLVRMPLLRRDAVVETSLGLLLYGLRKFGIFQAKARQNHWARGELAQIAPVRLSDVTIGVVGAGVIGRRIITVLESLGANVCACDPKGLPQNVTECSFLEMTQCCQAVVFACDLNSDSENMLNQSWLNVCTNNILIVNCARGKLIDMATLKEGLDSQKIIFAGLDVFPTEPFPKLNWVQKYDNVVFLPHSAGFHPQLADMTKKGLLQIVKRYTNSEEIPFEICVARATINSQAPI